MKNNNHRSKREQNSIVRLPGLFDRDIETKLSDQAHRSYVSKLAACRRFVDCHFLLNYGLSAYPICDILLVTQVSELGITTVDSVSTELAIPSKILDRYLAIALDQGLVSVNSGTSDPEISLTAKGAQDLLLITNAISEVAFTLRPLDSTKR